MADDIQQPPEDLKMKELDDSKFVTETLTKMQPLVHRLLAVWFVLVAVLTIATIIQTWPSAGSSPVVVKQEARQPSASKADTLARVDTARADTTLSPAAITMSLDQRYLLVALLFGILGGASHGLASLMDFRGQRRLFRSWSLWYFALPFLGGMLAIIFYVAVRAGLLTGGGKDVTESINIYGVAAFSAVVGLFTDRATNKLGEIFGTIFATKAKEREGKLTSGDTPPEPPPQ